MARTPKFNFGQEFLKMFRESIVVQSLATAMLLGTVCAMYLVPLFRNGSSGEIPPLLAALTGTVMGYWFKSKALYQAALASSQGSDAGTSAS